ncbi:hypothetical protein [Hydrogenophaga atypica]|uniref:ApeI dehydratase-like domain-containing protein n=1 Tax=Hydrogenophaga atypica TaxID=249409 RepID=A0ABW2QIC0_9BURK
MAMLEQVWRVPLDHPALAGHFPGHPIVPGVVVLDQVLCLAQSHVGGAVSTWQVGQVKFVSPSGPGDELSFVLEAGARGGLSFVVRCAERDVAVGSLTPGSP